MIATVDDDVVMAEGVESMAGVPTTIPEPISRLPPGHGSAGPCSTSIHAMARAALDTREDWDWEKEDREDEEGGIDAPSSAVSRANANFGRPSSPPPITSLPLALLHPSGCISLPAATPSEVKLEEDADGRVGLWEVPTAGIPGSPCQCPTRSRASFAGEPPEKTQAHAAEDSQLPCDTSHTGTPLRVQGGVAIPKGDCAEPGAASASEFSVSFLTGTEASNIQLHFMYDGNGVPWDKGHLSAPSIPMFKDLEAKVTTKGRAVSLCHGDLGLQGHHSQVVTATDSNACLPYLSVSL
uniref:Probable 3-oxoacyl-[acyl-carrier-protein] reductase oxidoreductase (EC) n=1 Tax=Ganoderma boninense TaxID=34458 RepID=A0A5K1JYS0_9APHY|nr:Probable 3-oxoacyl-[acyl-carrier-protein] reductase oxidoreductase (EC [Ganoderma boninense]